VRGLTVRHCAVFIRKLVKKLEALFEIVTTSEREDELRLVAAPSYRQHHISVSLYDESCSETQLSRKSYFCLQVRLSRI
jgi:hypothetical protein